jgi:ABC-type multidrug transport system fused ATPase/permease subunit
MRDIIAKLSDTLTGREKRHAAYLFGLMIVGAILEMLGVGAIPAFITLLSDPHRIERISWLGPVVSRAASHGENAIVLGAAAVLFVLFLVKNSYLAILTILTARYVTRRQINIARRLFAVYVSSPYTFHLQRNTAELLRNANNEALDVVGAVLMPGLTLLMEALTVTAILALLLVAEPFISLVAFVFLGGSTLLFIRVIRRRMLYYGKLVQEYRMRMIQTVNEALGGIKITRVLGREQHFLKAYAHQADQFAESLRYRQIMTDLPRLYLEVVAIVGILGVAALLIIQERPVRAIIPALSILAVAIVRMIPSFNRITSSLTSIRYGRFSLDVVHADLVAHRKRESARPAPETPIGPFSATIGL